MEKEGKNPEPLHWPLSDRFDERLGRGIVGLISMSSMRGVVWLVRIRRFCFHRLLAGSLLSLCPFHVRQLAEREKMDGRTN
jgi:hypothetical protein